MDQMWLGTISLWHYSTHKCVQSLLKLLQSCDKKKKKNISHLNPLLIFLLQSLQTTVELINPQWRCADRSSAFLYTLIVPVRLRLRMMRILKGAWVCVHGLVPLDSQLPVSFLLWSFVSACSRLVLNYCAYSATTPVNCMSIFCLFHLLFTCRVGCRVFIRQVLEMAIGLALKSYSNMLTWLNEWLTVPAS